MKKLINTNPILTATMDEIIAVVNTAGPIEVLVPYAKGKPEWVRCVSGGHETWGTANGGTMNVALLYEANPAHSVGDRGHAVRSYRMAM